MNFTEHQDYLIAIFVSLIFHFLLLMFYLPGIPASKNPGLETFPVGLVEIVPGSSKGMVVPLSKNQPSLSVVRYSHGRRLLAHARHQGNTVIKPDINHLNQRRKDANLLSRKDGIPVSVNSKGNLGNQSVPNGNNAIKPNPTQPPQDATAFPKKEETAVSDYPVDKHGNQSAPSGKTEAITATEDSETSQPEGLGTGKGMVTVLGPMPAYPRNAKNEGKEGYVETRILVNAAGSLELVIVTDSSDDIRLDYAAVSSIEQGWKFKAVAKNYFIDLIFSFKIKTGVSIQFIDSETRP